MSRGLGRIERDILAALRQHGGVVTVFDMAGYLTHATAIPESVYRSHARAMRSLARKGLLFDGGREWRDGRRRYGLAGSGAFKGRVNEVIAKQGWRADDRDAPSRKRWRS